MLNWRTTTVGVGRDDGEKAGEFSPILYRPDVWELKSQETKWLSKTPDHPSKSWDAASLRIVTIATFQHRVTRRMLLAMNTHLDDQGSVSRKEAVNIILEKIHYFTDQSPHRTCLPIFLTGDFNSEPQEGAYDEMTSAKSPMRDLQPLVAEDTRYGDLNTYTGFDPATERPKRIDFIFINKIDTHPAECSEPRSCWLVDGYSVLPNRFEDGVYNSDHRVVIGDLSMI